MRRIDRLKGMPVLAPLVLRYGITFVYLWFGITQVMNPSGWTGWIPQWIRNTGVAPETVIYVNGIGEIVFGILLGAGLFTRVAAAVLTVHTIGITISVGYNPVGIRDIAILIGSASIFFYGPDWLCIDWYRKKFRRRRQAEREYYRGR